jgi:glutaredoxin 3
MSRIVIYGASYCAFCVRAKNFLKKNSVPLEWIDVEEEAGQNQLFQLQKQYNWSTIPMIFLDERFVGGYQ